MEPDRKVIVEGEGEEANIVVLLPIRGEETIVCPLCAGRGRFKGVRKIENLVRHHKEHHPGVDVIYRCWRCEFTAPEGKRYPRKVVTQHCSECVPDIEPVRGADGDRRREVRRQLGLQNIAASPVTRSQGARRRQNTGREPTTPEGPSQGPVQQIPPGVLDSSSSSEEVFHSPRAEPLDPREHVAGDEPVVGGETITPASPAPTNTRASTPNSNRASLTVSPNNTLATPPQMRQSPNNIRVTPGTQIGESLRQPQRVNRPGRQRPTREQARLVNELDAVATQHQLEATFTSCSELSEQA